MSPADDLLAEIQRRVAERRAAGDYPPDLERRLDDAAARGPGDHFSAGDLAALRSALDALDVAARFDPARIPTTSRSRLGTGAHRAVAVAVARQTGGVLAQVGQFAEQVEATLRLIVDYVGRPGGDHPLLAAQLDAALDRLAILQQRLDALPPTPNPHPTTAPLAGFAPLPAALSRSAGWWDPVRWLTTLDGPFDEVTARRARLAEGMGGPVLDVACRRGELLAALRDRGIEATGVDPDPRLAAAAAAAGLAAAHAGPLVTLARAADRSLGTVAALGLPGRLEALAVADLAALAADKLRAGGSLVLEGSDPHGPRAGIDPIDGAPLNSQWVRFACAEAGFADVRLDRADDAPPGARPGCYLVTATR